jgi:hypothetical protein
MIGLSNSAAVQRAGMGNSFRAKCWCIQVAQPSGLLACLPVASIQQSLSASDGLSNTQDPSIKVQGIKVA